MPSASMSGVRHKAKPRTVNSEVNFMSAKKNRLDQLKVVTPCSSSWELMSGNNQKRFCADCNKSVFDFSQMTRRQVEAVVAAHQGKLCGRITRRPDGSLLTLETPPPIQISTRRASPFLTATVAALLGISVPAAAQNAILASANVTANGEKEAGKKKRPKPLGKGDASFGGTALDSKGTAIADATVKLISIAGGEERSLKTSAEGEFLFPQIPAGAYLLLIEAGGFITHLNNNLTIDAASEQRLDVTLQPNERVMVAGGIGAPRPQTLLDLYRSSDAIVVADVGPSAIAEINNESKLLKTVMRISTPVKGKFAAQTIAVYHWTYSDNPPQFKKGERQLLFLSHRESEDGKPLPGFELTGWDNAAKQLDDATMNLYVRRMMELSAILQKPDPATAEITEWLVQLAEDSKTRWEGVHQLFESSWRSTLLADNQKNKEEEKSEITKETDTETETEAEAEGAEEDPPTEPQTPEDAAREAKEAAEYEAREKAAAKLFEVLTSDQKTRLTNLLFSIPKITESDLELVELVQRLEDERLVPYLVTQLQQVANDAPALAESLMLTLAETIADDDLKGFANDYSAAAKYAESELNDDEPFVYRPFRFRRIGNDVMAATKRSMELKKFLTLVEVKLKP